MNFNICTVNPPGYIHAHAFDELAILIEGGLCDLGHTVKLSSNQIDQHARNIIIGCHLLDFRSAEIVPKNSIIINTEQLSPEIGSWNKNIMYWLQEYEAWDYSVKNIENVTKVGLPSPKYLMLGYHKSLKTICNDDKLDVDVLFYGSMNARRRAILDQLHVKGLKVKELFGVYADERDKWIARSKIVLNIHFFHTQIFEIVRCFYLMINEKAIVAEVNKDTSIEHAYQNGVHAVPYEDIVDECIRIANDQSLRKHLENRAYENIVSMPQKQFLHNLL